MGDRDTTNGAEDTHHGSFICTDCGESVEAVEGKIGCDNCGKCYEVVRRSKTKEVWDDGERVAELELRQGFICQFCGVGHDDLEDHEDHVERMHYSEVLREAEEA